MNVQIAKEAYSKVKKETSSSAKNNHANVGMALKRLKSSMTNMIQNETHETNETFKKSYKNALYAIYVLQKSLDFEKGGELAQNLFRLYEFCKISVQDAVITGETKKSNLAPCCTYIGDIIESWEKVYK
jgi:flagellar protein FliS